MKTELTSANRVTSGDDFPRLKLEVGERAIIVCIEKEPEMEFVHTLRSPQLDDQGKLVKTVVQSNRPGGKAYTKNEMDFVGQHRCFGDPAILLADGSGDYDPKNCVTCAAVDESGGRIEKPERRYAMHVLQYSIQQGGMTSSWAIATPLSMKCVVWTFGKGRFNDLIDLAETWGDLRMHDLRLGPCEAPKTYQKYDMNMIPGAAWLEQGPKGSDEQKAGMAYAQDVYKNNRCPDLSALIGRKITRDQALEDIATVLDAWARADGGGVSEVGPSVQTDSATIDATVGNILDGIDEPAPATAADLGIDLDAAFDKSAPADVVPQATDAPVPDPEPVPVAATPAPAPAAVAAPDDLSALADVPAPAESEVLDLDSFLDGLPS